MHSAMPYSRPQLWSAVEETIQEKKNRSYFANAFTIQIIYYTRDISRQCQRRTTFRFLFGYFAKAPATVMLVFNACESVTITWSNVCFMLLFHCYFLDVEFMMLWCLLTDTFYEVWSVTTFKTIFISSHIGVWSCIKATPIILYQLQPLLNVYNNLLCRICFILTLHQILDT